MKLSGKERMQRFRDRNKLLHQLKLSQDAYNSFVHAKRQYLQEPKFSDIPVPPDGRCCDALSDEAFFRELLAYYCDSRTVPHPSNHVGPDKPVVSPAISIIPITPVHLAQHFQSPGDISQKLPLLQNLLKNQLLHGPNNFRPIFPAPGPLSLNISRAPVEQNIVPTPVDQNIAPAPMELKHEYVTTDIQTLLTTLERCHNCLSGKKSKVNLKFMDGINGNPFFSCCNQSIDTDLMYWCTNIPDGEQSDPIDAESIFNGDINEVIIKIENDNNDEDIKLELTEPVVEDLDDSMEFSCSEKPRELDPLMLDTTTQEVCTDADVANKNNEDGTDSDSDDYSDNVAKNDATEDNTVTADTIYDDVIMKSFAKKDIKLEYGWQDNFFSLKLDGRKMVKGRGKHLKYPEMFVCEFCGQNFSGTDRAYKFYYHRNRDHTHEMVFPCKTCNYTGWSERALIMHSRTHSEGSFVCHLCGMTLKSHKNLQAHMSVHSKVKSFTCQFCDKTFKRRDAVIIHERCHTGYRPHVCPQCDSAYPQRVQLKLHLRRCPGHKLCGS